MNVIFEPDPREINRRLGEEDALHVVLVDDDRIPTAVQVDSAVLAGATDERESIRARAEAWAGSLRGGLPEIAYVPTVASYAQVQIAIALARRDVRVVVGTTRERFLRLADDADVAAALWT